MKESDTSTLVSIWEKNEDICSKFDNQESLQRQYPEYAYTLINKANEIKKEISLHNYKPLIEVLSEQYKRDFHTMKFIDIETFFQEYKKDGTTLIPRNMEKHLTDFVDFEERHVPRLKLYAFAGVIKNKIINESNSSSKHQTIDQACSFSVDEQVPQPVNETTGTIEHISVSDSEHGEVSEGDSTKIPVSDQVNDIQNNNIRPSSRSEKKSKLPIIAASTLAVAGVALGIAIAVHLEMLVVGIAVGACCLVAAAIIYYCNEPSKSLENINVQGFSKEGQEPTL